LKSGKTEEDQKLKDKKSKKRKHFEASNQSVENDRKKSRQELISKTREEVEADYKAASFAPDVMERKQMQTETLSAVFETYFRILKHTMQSIGARCVLYCVNYYVRGKYWFSWVYKTLFSMNWILYFCVNISCLIFVCVDH